MTNLSAQQLVSAINSLPEFDALLDNELTMLSGGQCNLTVLVRRGDKPLVVRFLSNDVIANPIDRQREYHHQALAAEHQIASQPLAYYSINQLLSKNIIWRELSDYFNAVIVAKYCVGTPLADLKKEKPSAPLKAIASLLARLHLMPYRSVDVVSATTPFARLAQYWQLFCRQYPQSLASHQAVIAEVLNQLKNIKAVDYCLIHGDVNPGNIIVNGSNVKLIDWEYSAVDDPYIDVASTIVELELDLTHRKRFIQDYARSGTEIEDRRLIVFESYYCALCWLWSQIQLERQQDLTIRQVITVRSEYYYKKLLGYFHRTK